MYLSNTTEKIEIVLAGAVATNQLEWTASYQDITSAGMTLPQSSSQGLTNNGTAVDMVAAPAASTNRQVVHITVYNDDTAAATVKIRKDISGTEYVYVNQTLQPGDTLQWSREDGWRILTSTSQSPITFTTFTANGTYTKPAGLKAAFVVCIGAGGGGGSGTRQAAGTNRFGGGGGGGGAAVWSYFPASALADTTAVTVGTGGTGGAGVLTDTTNGNNGNTGGATLFGGLIQANGGIGGTGGTTAGGTAGNGGSGALGTPIYGPLAMSGNGGSAGTTNSASSAGTTGLNMGGAAPGGAGGAGINNTNVSATTSGAGGGIWQNGILQAGPNAGASPNGVNNKSVFLHFSQTLSSGVGVGTGGAGGYPGFVNGGNGGYCAGGGGGSGSLNGTTSGKGGDGGGGLCIVMNIF